MSSFGRNGVEMNGKERNVSRSSAPSWRGSDVRKGLMAGMLILVEEGGNTGRNPIAWAANLEIGE